MIKAQRPRISLSQRCRYITVSSEERRWVFVVSRPAWVKTLSYLGMWNKHSPGQKSFFTLTFRGWGDGPAGAEHSKCWSPNLTGFQQHRYNWILRPRLTRFPVCISSTFPAGPFSLTPSCPPTIILPTPGACCALLGFCSYAGLGMWLQTQVRASGRFPHLSPFCLLSSVWKEHFFHILSSFPVVHREKINLLPPWNEMGISHMVLPIGKNVTRIY